MKRIKKVLVVLIILLSSIVIFTGCSSNKNEAKENELQEVHKYAKEHASKEWYDYSYDIIENYDEKGIKRYHLVYHYALDKYYQRTIDKYLVFKDGTLTEEEF